MTDALHRGCSYADLIVRAIGRGADRVAFIDEAIPVTSLGKPDKKALRARFWGERGRQVN